MVTLNVAHWPKALAPLSVAAATLLAHLPALSAGFTLDDRDFFVNNASTRSLPAAFAGFGSAFPANAPERGLYRPVTALSYAIDTALGPAPWVPHASNLLLYVLAALLVHRLALALRFSVPVALVTALLFALHPVHCEAVDSISGRSEVLSLLFCSAALLVYARADFAPRVGVACAAATLYALAALSKESALVLPAVIATGCWVYAGSLRRVPYGSLALLAVTGIACFALRISVLGRVTAATTILGGASISTHVWTLGRTTAEYARLLVVPGALAPDFYYTHSVGIHHAPSALAVIGLALLCGLVVAFGIALRRRSPYALPFAIVGAYLLPVSHLVPFGALMAERFLLLPSLGYALLVGLLFGRFAPQAGRVAVPALAVLLIGFGARSFARALDWHDSVSLWSPVAAEIRNDFRVYNNLALGYLERGDVEHAKPLLERSLTLVPDNPVALGNLGQILLHQGDLDAARSTYERALRKSPRYTTGWSNLGVVELRAGRLSHAIAALERAQQLDPSNSHVRDLLARARPLLAQARRFAEVQQTALDTSDDPALLKQLEGACRAIDDAACVSRARVRSATLVEAMKGGESGSIR